MKKIQYKSLIRRLGIISSKLVNFLFKNNDYKDILKSHSIVTINNRIRLTGYGLWLSKEQLKSFGFYLRINPADIKKQTKHGQVPFLDDSNWCKYSTDFVPHKSISEMLEQNIPWKLTSQYKHMCEQIRLGKKAYNCSSIKEVDNYEKKLRSSWDNIIKNGYQIQGYKGGIYPDDIIVSINNNFEPILTFKMSWKVKLPKFKKPTVVDLMGIDPTIE